MELFLWLAFIAGHKKAGTDRPTSPDSYRDYAGHAQKKCLHFIVLERDEQHPETLPMLLTQMFVVHFVRFAQSYQVFVVGVFEPLKSLMDQDIVYHEITKSVECDSEPYEKQIVHTSLYAKIKKDDAG